MADQTSDHSPLWIEIETDYADHYLTEFAAGWTRSPRTGPGAPACPC